MTASIAAGIYEDLITNGLRIELEKLNKALVASQQEIDPADIPRVLSRYASGLLTRVLESLSDDDREFVGVDMEKAFFGDADLGGNMTAETKQE